MIQLEYMFSVEKNRCSTKRQGLKFNINEVPNLSCSDQVQSKWFTLRLVTFH